MSAYFGPESIVKDFPKRDNRLGIPIERTLAREIFRDPSLSRCSRRRIAT